MIVVYLVCSISHVMFLYICKPGIHLSNIFGKVYMSCIAIKYRSSNYQIGLDLRRWWTWTSWSFKWRVYFAFRPWTFVLLRLEKDWYDCASVQWKLTVTNALQRR